MPNTALKRLPGIALVVALDGTPIGCYDTLKVAVKGNKATPTSADSDWVQKVFTTKDGTGSLGTWLGSEQAPTLTVGDEMLVLSIKEGTNDVSPSLADLQANSPGKCRVMGVDETYQSDPAKGEAQFEWGFID